MYVDEYETKIVDTRNGRKYYFCSNACRIKFERPEKEFKHLKIMLAISWPLSILILLITYILHFEFYLFALLGLSAIVQFYPGMKFYKGLIDAVRNKSTNMDMLIAIGTSAAWAYSAFVVIFPSLITASHGVYFDSSALIVTLILTGDYLQHLAEKNATSALDKLFAMQPKTVNVVRQGKIIEEQTEKVVVGDILVIKPGDRIPVDGTVIEGTSDVDESTVTGESMPVKKTVGDAVISGTINKSGSFKMRAIKVGGDTTLSQIIGIVEAAASNRVPIQKLADKVSAYFVPVVIFVAIASAVLWGVFGSVGIQVAILIFVSVVIIACPCAFGIATPAALLVGSGRASSYGILIKKGEAIETALKINAIVLDKTGTITEGSPEVTSILPLDGHSENDILFYAASAEQQSEHPIAKAIIRKAIVIGILPSIAKDFSHNEGKGVSALVNGKTVAVGNINMFKEVKGAGYASDKAINMQNEGNTALICYLDEMPMGIIAVSDPVRKDSKKGIDALKSMGMEVYMATGDNKAVAERVAKSVGIENYIAEASPMSKAELVKKLQTEGNIVAVVGDGINDAPALTQADLGIAIGAGTEIAIDSGSVVLMKNSINDIVKLLRLSRSITGKIKQNLAWAFGYNIALIPLAAGALIPFFGTSIYDALPILSAVAMALSSTIVVTNSLLLKRTKI